MKATIAVYQNHEKAVRAVKKLVRDGIDSKEISIIGKGEMIEDRMHITSVKGLKKAPVPIGTIAGGLLGVLAGAGMLMVPGLGFVFLAGKFIGLLGGATVGMVTGGLASILISMGFRKDQVVRFDKHLENGNYLVIVDGEVDHIDQAHKILHTQYVSLCNMCCN